MATLRYQLLSYLWIRYSIRASKEFDSVEVALNYLLSHPTRLEAFLYWSPFKAMCNFMTTAADIQDSIVTTQYFLEKFRWKSTAQNIAPTFPQTGLTASLK